MTSSNAAAVILQLSLLRQLGVVRLDTLLMLRVHAAIVVVA